MDNQHKKIKGYRDLSQVEIDLMNEIKEQGKHLEILVDKLYRTIDTELYWISSGKLDLQKGIMALVRAVAKPESF